STARLRRPRWLLSLNWPAARSLEAFNRRVSERRRTSVRISSIRPEVQSRCGRLGWSVLARVRKSSCATDPAHIAFDCGCAGLLAGFARACSYVGGDRGGSPL